MKKCYPFIFTVLLYFTVVTAMAQTTGQPVRFAAGNFITGNTVSRQGFSKADLAASLYGDNYFVLVQFSKLPGADARKQLANAGIRLGDYIPGNAYLATIKTSFDLSLAASFSIISVNTVPSFYKIDRALYAYNGFSNTEKLFAVNYYTGAGRQAVQQELQRAGAVIITSKFTLKNTIFIQPDKKIIDAVAALPFVSYIGLQPVEDRPLNYNSTAIHAVSGLQSASGRNLNGKGITVGVGDNAEITNAHIDFSGRVINRVPYPISFHGIHVSGTVAGGGILNPKHHGMAPRATIVSQWYSDVITNTPVYVTDHNMIATCNSYTAADEGCTGNGVYDVLSNYADNQLRDNGTVLHVFAAGNDGDSTCGAYPKSFGTIKTGWQCAKNVLTVGAMDQTNYNIASFSSRGPVNDGRIKPEIVANGLNQFSTRQNNTYGFNSGTSMAAPVLTGVTALLNEKYRLLYGTTPKASLLKALMCNTAEDLGKKGPDYTYGFGMLNARRAVEAMEGNQYFISSTPTSYNINVPSGVRRLKVMLYWADTAAAPNAGATLVNDLDLTVTDPSANTKLPLVLSTVPGNVELPALPGADHINNIEQVVIDSPAAGIYSLNVSAFALPQGPQEYVLTYQLDRFGVTVEYPFGGETWVPGETETIRWSADGDDANTFTVEYSDNNGGSWTTLAASVPDTARSYVWNAVSATPSNTALIRVSRNSSAYTDQSDQTFVVLGQPTVTSSVPCEGYVQLNWGAVAGATSYDVMQLKGDTMTVIANTAATSFLVEGLSNTTTYWFAIRAKNTAVAGRRSLAVPVLPASGTCSSADYTNNLKAVAIIAPVSGRAFTSSAWAATEQVQFTIKNLDDVATTGSYDLYYDVNGGGTVMESSSVSIAASGTATYSFAATNAFANPGVYTIRAWVKRTSDNRVFDDTTTITIKHLDNQPVTLPLTDGFESTTVNNYSINTIGLDGDDRVDFKTNAARGRARTFVNTGFAWNGSRAITLDQFPVNTALVTDSLLMTYNAESYNGTQLRLDFYYKNHGQANNPNNKVWIRGSDTSPWIFAYDLVANQSGLGGWAHGHISVNDVLDTVMPAQPITKSFQVKFGQQGNTSANVSSPILDQDDGYTFDDVTLAQPTTDIAITGITSPAASGCGVAGSQLISLTIKNYTATTFTNVPVTYVLNGTPVTELIPNVVPGVQPYSFSTPVNFAANTDYDLDAWIYEATDDYRSNDSILNYAFRTSAVINTFPYLEGFEANDGGWYTKGSNSSWQWGTPTKPVINKAANGTKAWVTGLSSNYKNNELSYLYSPCFDLTALAQPVLSFSHIFYIEDGVPADYNWVEYSANGGITWTKLGTNGAGTNWYNDPTGANQWRTSLSKWHVASIDIPVKSANMRFRIVMSSDQGFNVDGVGIDDIHVFDKALIYTGTQLLNTTQTVSGSNWVHFNNGAGRRIASVNANGQNLGSTIVDVYPFAGTVRTRNGQYYLNRNIVMKPATPPVGNVSVRFYFTDAEAKSLIAATGCSTCTKPADPYELGVTKYSGTVLQENGTHDDNFNGMYSYILPANTEIVPYDNGYYAEFAVSSFSEFWLNNGGVNADAPLPLNLISFEAVKQNKKVLLQWATANEVNNDHFEIERSKDGRVFVKIETVAATNQPGHVTYTRTDAQPFGGLNYYRLKIIDNSGASRYSPVRKVNFSGDGLDIVIYPNPVINGSITIAAATACNKAVLYDAAGRQVKVFALQGRTNSIDVTGIAKGIYQLKVVAENGVHTEKVMVQ